jgi:hypothetical protein
MTTTKTTRTPKQPLYVLLTEDRSGGYWHLYGRLVAQRYEQSSWVPDGPDDHYIEGTLYSGLQLRCQGDEQSRARALSGERDAPVYGFDCGYHDVFHVDRRRAVRMAKTLTQLEAKLDKLTETRGYVHSYGEYVGRVAEALGCVGIGFQRSATSRHLSGERWQWDTIGGGVSRIDRLVAAWVDEARPQAPAADGNATQEVAS